MKDEIYQRLTNLEICAQTNHSTNEDATAEALDVCDGGMIERFGCSAGNIKTLLSLSAAGKLAQVHAQYADTNVATFNSSLACFLIGAGEHSYYGAGGGWNGDGHDSVMTSWLKQWGEYDKALGAPLADATVVISGNANQTTVYTREFKSGTRVVVNLTMTDDDEQQGSLGDDEAPWVPTASEESDDGAIVGKQLTLTCIYWSDGTTTGGAPGCLLGSNAQ